MTLITADKAAIYEFTEKKSRFIGYIFPIVDEMAAQECIAALKKEHKAATHIVYAFCLGASLQRSTDDGEPAGTAGRPVLEAIKSAGLDNVIVLVVRYFGGTLLGTGGLVRAYTQAAQGAIREGGRAELIAGQRLLLSIPYTALSDINYHLEQLQAEIIKRDFNEKALLTVNIANSDWESLQMAIKQAQGDYYLLEDICLRRRL